MFCRSYILFVAAAMLICAYAYAYECTKDHESENICGRRCQKTCQNPNPNPHFCPHTVCTWESSGGCRCDTDYYRDIDSGNCYRLEDCP